MKCKFVEAEKASYPVTTLCQVMGVKRSTYYAWRKRLPSARALEDEALIVRIKAEFNCGRQSYGSPRIHAALVADGCQIGLNRVARLMRENGIGVRPRRGYRCTTTERDPAQDVAPNTLDRDFNASAPNEKWVTDVTFIPTDEGWLYLATMLDLYNREVVGWAMDDTNDQNLTARALEMALESHQPPDGLSL